MRINNTRNSLVKHSRALKNDSQSNRYKPVVSLKISADALYLYKQFLSTSPFLLAKLKSDDLELMNIVQGESIKKNPYYNYRTEFFSTELISYNK